jgi:hypothetical protein
MISGKKIFFFSLGSIILIGIIVYFAKLFNLGNRAFKYFDYAEFDSPAMPGETKPTYFNPVRGKNMITGSGKLMMNLQFLQRLDNAREIAGTPFFITSGYRTQAYNDTLPNSATDSAHTRGYAADISAPINKEKIIRALIAAGFNRIGEGANFVHVDSDPNKTPFKYWTYGNPQTVYNPFNL